MFALITPLVVIELSEESLGALFILFIFHLPGIHRSDTEKQSWIDAKSAS